jgi:hypothetical protein
LLAIITDPQISDEQIGGLIRGGRIGWPRLRSAVAQNSSTACATDFRYSGFLRASIAGSCHVFARHVPGRS